MSESSRMIPPDVEDRETCRECGGVCCKFMPGPLFPEDLSEISVPALVELLTSRLWQVDSYDSEFFGYFLRPRALGDYYEDCVYSPTWGRVTCVFLGESGCKLPLEKRPEGCRTLIPDPSGPPKDCEVPYDEYHSNVKHAAAVAWAPYQEDIRKAMETASEELKTDEDKPELDEMDAIDGLRVLFRRWEEEGEWY